MSPMDYHRPGDDPTLAAIEQRHAPVEWHVITDNGPGDPLPPFCGYCNPEERDTIEYGDEVDAATDFLGCDVPYLLDRLRAVTADLTMYRDRYFGVQAVLDTALGTEEEAGAGEGIVADVHLLADQRDEALRQVAAVRALMAVAPVMTFGNGYPVRAVALAPLYDALRALDSAQPQNTTPEASDSPRQWTEGDTLRETAHMMMENWPTLTAQRAHVLTRIARAAFRTYDKVYGPQPATPQDTPPEDQP